MRPLIAALLVGLLSTAASAQVIYLPVQYQYGQDQPYFYGGNDPCVFASAERTSALLRFQGIQSRSVRVYSDLFPYANAAEFGFTPDDARNEAYFNQQRYFRKGELLDQAVEVNGTYYVPPAPQVCHVAPIPVKPMIKAPRPTERRRGVILIIPKKRNPERAQPARPTMFVSAS